MADHFTIPVLLPIQKALIVAIKLIPYFFHPVAVKGWNCNLLAKTFAYDGLTNPIKKGIAHTVRMATGNSVVMYTNMKYSCENSGSN